VKNKICSCCKQNLDISNFYIEKKNSKIKPKCKKCTSLYKQKKYLEDRESLIERNRKWRKDNPLKYKEYLRKNQSISSQRTKEWRKKNPEKHRLHVKKHSKKQNDKPLNKLKHRIRTRILSAMKRKSEKTSTVILLGCSIANLKDYLESLWLPGMSWENYGIWDGTKNNMTWHIDHIIPCSSFDLTKEEEQRKCFHYTNLQPLWAIDNILKGDKI
jgi:hypothetical protein